jgi:SAM-dependent methyltransferase
MSPNHQEGSGPGSLTDERFWDGYWEGLLLPREVKKGTSLYLDAITDVFDRWLGDGVGKSALEIGGAPGQYVVYIHRRHGYRPHVLDSSQVGCEATRRNFQLLRIDGAVTQGDMFDQALDLPLFDLVFSLGLIEHFDDLRAAVAAHARFVKPNGLLILGCPNFLGINGVLLRRLAPRVLAVTKTENMDIAKWDNFEHTLGLEQLFAGYVGGFEPNVSARADRTRRMDQLAVKGLRVAGSILGRRQLRALRGLNARAWSGYVMGVYRVSDVPLAITSSTK